MINVGCLLPGIVPPESVHPIKTILRGRVHNINSPSDVAGVYGAAGAGLAIGRGARAIVLTNQKGAVLELSGQQFGLMANADLSGLAISLR